MDEDFEEEEEEEEEEECSEEELDLFINPRILETFKDLRIEIASLKGQMQRLKVQIRTILGET